MSARRSERLLNLLIMLLVQRRAVTKDEIRAALYDGDRGDAFERKFDRDKEELRALGVPVETVLLDEFFDDEVGYRIRPDEYALPEITFTAEEAAVVALAGKVWGHASVAEDAAAALRKLQPLLPVDTVAVPELVQPQIHADEPCFDVFWQATQERRTVTFDYRRPGQGDPLRRTLEPWGVVRHGGRWYAVGLDLTRGEERVFRLSRVVGTATFGRHPDAFEVPVDADLREVAARLAPRVETLSAIVLVRPGAGHWLRRRGRVLAEGAEGPDGRSDWERIGLDGPSETLVAQVLALGENAYVESPSTLRQDVVERLAALVESAPGGGQ